MWFMGDFVGDEKIVEKLIPAKCGGGQKRTTVYFQKILVQIFSAQWRADMRKTPNVILGCFRGLGKK